MFFLHHQHFLEAASKVLQVLGIRGIGHAELEHGYAERRRLVITKAKFKQRLAHIGPGLAGGDDAVARLAALQRHAVESVDTRKGERSIELVRPQAWLLQHPAVGDAQV